MGFTVEQIDEQCDQLFGEVPPIQFIPRQNRELDMKMQQVLQAGNVRIPIVHVGDASMNISRANLYLVGSQRITINIQRDKVMCRVGGGYEEFGEYLLRNHRQEERKLVVLMIKTQESLEWVVSALIAGRKQIRNVLKENNEAAQKELKKSKSATRHWR